MLSIVNNIAAFKAQVNLQGATSMQSSSLKSLSTGLRINQASDDASGLAISEKMRTQIRGLKKANENSQNGISMLQTAEGALNETHSILQRMRELSVQASNGTLTANDRVEVQKEVDALKDEIDGISTRTEFNTKKLLTGDATGLASVSTNRISAVMRGAVENGEYQLEFNAVAGKGQIQSTSVFRLKDGVQGVEEADLDAQNASTSLTFLNVAADSIDFTFNIKGEEYKIEDFAATGTVATDGIALRDAINNDENLNQFLVAVDNGTGAVTITAREGGKAANGYTLSINEDKTAANIAIANDTLVNFTGGTDSATGISELSNVNNLKASPTNGAEYTINIDAGANGTLGAGVATDIYGLVGQYAQEGSTTATIDNTTLITSAVAGAGVHLFTSSSNSSMGGYALLEFTTDGYLGGVDANGDPAILNARVSFDGGESWYSAENVWDGTGVTTVTDGTYTLEFNNATTTTGNYQSGDRILLALNDNDNAGASDLTRLDGFNPSTGDIQTGAVFRHVDDQLNDGTVTLKGAVMDISTGQVTYGTVDASFNEAQTGQALADGVVTFKANNGGGDAFGNTKLEDIDRFYDADGNFILGANGETISIYNAYGNKAEIYLDGGDSLNDVVDKIKNAILGDVVDGGLGMQTGVREVDENAVTFVDTPTLGTSESQLGTIVVRSTRTGENGRLFFSANEDIMTALGISQSQEATENSMHVVVKDGLSGQYVGEDITTDNILHNVIEGVEIEFDQSIDITANFNESSRKIEFSSVAGHLQEYVKIVDNSIDFQIGANQGQTLNASIAEINAHALRVDRVQVTDQDSAKDAITQIDKAVDMVSSERAKIGAWVNRLEHTINNLDVQEENQTAAESRIRDLNIAQETTKLSKSQILSQASTSMLAQANQQAQGLMSLLR